MKSDPETVDRLLLLPAQGGAASGVKGTQKRQGGGIHARLKTIPTSQLFQHPAVNVRSLENKLDLIRLGWTTQHETRDAACLFLPKRGL